MFNATYFIRPMSFIPPVTYYLLVKDISTQVGSQRKERKKLLHSYSISPLRQTEWHVAGPGNSKGPSGVD